MAIVGTGMQRNDIDIHIENGVRDGWDISGCSHRERERFLMAQPDSRIAVTGCTQTGGKLFPQGLRLQHHGDQLLLAARGMLHGASSLNVINSRFDNNDWNQWYGSIGDQLSRLPFRTVPTGFNLTAAMSGTIFDNMDASGEVILKLPRDADTSYRVPAGTWYGFYVAADNVLRVQAGIGAVIRVGGTVTENGGDVISDEVGNYLELLCLKDGGDVWVARASVGQWA